MVLLIHRYLKLGIPLMGKKTTEISVVFTNDDLDEFLATGWTGKRLRRCGGIISLPQMVRRNCDSIFHTKTTTTFLWISAQLMTILVKQQQVRFVPENLKTSVG
jgi:hypothetical protein